MRCQARIVDRYGLPVLMREPELVIAFVDVPHCVEPQNCCAGTISHLGVEEAALIKTECWDRAGGGGNISYEW